MQFFSILLQISKYILKSFYEDISLKKLILSFKAILSKWLLNFWRFLEISGDFWHSGNSLLTKKYSHRQK